MKKLCVGLSMILILISVGPLWKDRGVRLNNTEDYINDAKEEDRDLLALRMIDSFGAAVANYYNQGWRQEIIDSIKDVDESKEVFELQAKTFLAFSAVMKGEAPKEEYKLENTELIDEILESENEVKKQLWKDLTGDKSGIYSGGIESFDEETEKRLESTIESGEDTSPIPDMENIIVT